MSGAKAGAAGAAVLALTALVADAASAACEICSPASPVPQERHGSLVPTTILADSTAYQNDFEPGCGDPPQLDYVSRFSDLDLEAGVLLGASGNHLEIFDARDDPAAPVLRSRLCRPRLVGDAVGEGYQLRVEAPRGDPSVVAVAALGGMGATIVRVEDLASPEVVYQHSGYEGTSVAVADVAGSPHAFVSDDEGHIEVYDLALAQTLASPCQGSGCGVHRGRLAAIASFGGLRGDGSFLMTRNPSATTVWDVSSLSPRRVGDILGQSRGADLWVRGGALYAARGNASTGRLEIYRFPCQSSGTCGAERIADLAVPGAIVSGGGAVEASVDGGSAYVYAARANSLGSGPQNEYLFDVTDPTAARELTPDHEDGYWGWYYEQNSTGFRDVSPTDGVVASGHFVRAAVSVLDVHEIVQDGAPVAAFDLPSGDVYAGQNVTFTDRSTSQPMSWSWRIDALEFSTQQNPTWLVSTSPSYPRLFDVDLQACNAIGCSDRALRTLSVLDPAPSLTGVTVDGSVTAIGAVACQRLEFEGQGVLGRPPLEPSWEILRNGDASAVAGSGTTLTYAIPGNASTSDVFRARLTLSNGAPGSPASATSPPVTVTSEPLSVEAPTYDTPIVGGLVQFHLESGGASSWDWDFGDGARSTFLTALEGESPSHAYPQTSSAAQYLVVVTVHDCAGGSASRQITVEVPAAQQGGGSLTAGFVYSPASPKVGEPVTFTAQAQGNPTSFLWTFGDGFAAGPSGSATAPHTFAAPGTYDVELEVSKLDSSCAGGICRATVAKPVVVAEDTSEGTCIAAPFTMCVGNGRFELSVVWETDSEQGRRSGRARVVEGQTDEAGLFWFFDPGNWEMMVKVLPGCAVNGHYWVFGASTTDVGYRLFVTDTKTGRVKIYFNPPGRAAHAITDIEAFATCSQ